MNRVLRVIDSGVIEGRKHIALGQALIDRHREGSIPDTLRFLRFAPTALVGRHQALSREIDMDYCQANGIALVRRITGGGAIFLDPGQLGWELVIHRTSLARSTLTELAHEICEAAAAGLCRLGVDAAYRPRNDIEVDGRKISGTGGFFDGDTLFYQGTVLIDMDPATMVSALRVPKAKLERRDLDSAEQRVVTMKELLGEECPAMGEIQAALVEAFAERFALRAEGGALDDAVLKLADELYEEEIGQDDFVSGIDDPGAEDDVLEGEHTGPGGTVRTYVRLDGPARNRIGSVLITGDFFVTPPRVVYDLEAALRGIYLESIPGTLDCFFRDTPIEVLSVGRDDFAAAIERALYAP